MGLAEPSRMVARGPKPVKPSPPDATLRSVPVILTTAATQTRSVDVPLVRKPFDIDLLLAAITTSLNQPAMWDQHAAARV